MISIQVPHLMRHHPMSSYNTISHPAFFNSLHSMSKPVHQMLERKSSNSSGAKRRPSRAGTRSVATLTTAQLERKRANDREAQRAIRQRTKDHIESLEKRVAELTATSDINARLAQALQRNDDLEQENTILKNRLNQAVSAMAEGSPISPEMLTGPTSPTHRLRISTRSSSVPTPPRSIPSTSVTSSSLCQQGAWTQNFHGSVVSSAEHSPSLAEVSPDSSSIRWTQPHPSQQPSPAITDPGQMDTRTGCSQQSPVHYNFLLDNHVRTISPPASVDQRIIYQIPSTPISDSVGAYSHPTSAHVSAAGPGSLPSPIAYNQYPATPQSFIATSPHEQHSNMQPFGQQSPVMAHQIVYSLPTSANCSAGKEN